MSRLTTELTPHPSYGQWLPDSQPLFPTPPAPESPLRRSKDDVQNSSFPNPPWLWFAPDSATLATRRDLYALLGGKGRSSGGTPKDKHQRPVGLGCGAHFPGSRPMRKFPLGG